MMTRPTFWQLMAPARKVFVEWLDLAQREQEYQKVFNEMDSDSQYEDEFQMAGLGPALEKVENAPVIYQDMIQGGSKRFIHLTYSLGVRSSYELYADDKYNILKQLPKALARSYRFAEEMTAWNVFNLGFSSTGTITNDGVTLFNNQHPLLGGVVATNIAPGVTNVIGAVGTYPNRPATDVDLSFTAIQLMTNQFERMPDSQGLPIQTKVAMLVLPPELKWIAREILGSSGKPYTSDNEINALLGEDYTFTCPHYLTSQSAWFAVAVKAQHQLRKYTRQAPQSDFDDDFDTNSFKQKVFGRFSFGVNSWIGTWGSNGP